MLRAYGFTDKGPLRPSNEDRFGIDEALGLCVLADGMGGHNAGEVAARLAVEAVIEWVQAANRDGSDGEPVSWPFGFEPSLSPAGNLVRTAVLTAHVRVLDAAVSTAQYSGMGTTIVVALVRGDRLTVAHVGDSRLYLGGAPLRALTRDDSWLESARAAGSGVDARLLDHHPLRHALTSVVGVGACTNVHVAEEVLRDGELMALTTDGVHGVLDEHRLERLLADDAIETAPRRLVDAALASGSRDNCTAVVAQYRSG